MAGTTCLSFAQNANCSSRLVEQNLEQALGQKFGPRSVDKIQALAAGGQAPITKVTILESHAVGTLGNGVSCAATASVWREDTGQTIQVETRYQVINSDNDSYLRLIDAAQK